MNFIIRPENMAKVGQLGGKAAALAALRQSGLLIPAWFALSPEAFYRSLSRADRNALAAAQEIPQLKAIVARAEPGEEVVRQLKEALAELCPNGERVAVRSSALEEDSAKHSLAGQLDSFLFVSPGQVADKVAAVWRSGFSERLLAYRREHGLNLTPRPPSVLIQRMVDADVSGVAFGADPLSGRRGISVIAAVFGMGNALMSGECDADTYHVDRGGNILKRAIANKTLAQHFASDAAEGVRSEEITEGTAKKPALTDDQIRAVADLVRQTGRHFGRPQDIEWAFKNDRLYLLQSRPITLLAQMPDPDGSLFIWDNSNIVESFGGATTPLTYSFARRAYEEVYRQFCRLMRVPSATIATNDNVFRCMLGFIRGRVYYNLLNWYRVLAMLPGFTINREFMEQMMGVKEGLPENVLAEKGNATWRERLRDGFSLLGTMGGLITNHLLLPFRINRFHQRLERALVPLHPELAELRADEICDYYHDLERQLLTRWDAPIINDFFAMIFHGLLQKLGARWCEEWEASLQNELLCDEEGMISAEPARRVREMAELAEPDENFVALLAQGELDAILSEIEKRKKFKTCYREYLDRFGDRCLDELKLESPTLQDDPLLLLRSVAQYARRFRTDKMRPPSSIEETVRRKAEKRVRDALTNRRLRRSVFFWVLRHARARIRDRENLRFERTRLFGRVRRVFLELGRRFYALDLLEEPQDIFYLGTEEILSFIDGTGSCCNLQGLVALRKAEFAAYQEQEAPDERFETHGIVSHGQNYRASRKKTDVTSMERLKGIGCCPGLVRGPVRVVTDPRNAIIESGEILVAERTDPGWVMLFLSCSGLLVERGSLLSHSAIVAREMGIPAIVSLEGVTRWLKDGDWVEMDGSRGLVWRIEPGGDGENQ